MAWLELTPSGHFHVRFRLGTRKFKRSFKTTVESEAETRRIRLEETIRLVESGRLTIPEDVDVPTYLLSDGQLSQSLVAPESVKLGDLFDEYTESLPEGSMEANSLYTAKIHMKHLRRILRPGFVARNLTLAISERGTPGTTRKPSRDSGLLHALGVCGSDGA